MRSPPHPTSMRLHGCLALLLVAASSLSACRVSTRSSRTTAARVAAPEPGVASSPPPTEPSRAGPPVERATADPGAAAALRASGSHPALPLGDSVNVPGLTTLALLDTARTEARGHSAIGGIRQVELAEGQRAGFVLDVLEGDCLTLLAHAGLGVREVDLFVVAEAAPDGDILVQDVIGGPLAVVGGRAGCWRSPIARRVEIVVLARKGAGMILAAAFRSVASAPR